MQDERAIIVEHPPFRRPSLENRGAAGAEIETSVRFQAAEARYRIEHIEGEIPAAGIDRDARGDEVLWPGYCGKRRKLTGRGGTGRTLRLQHVDGVDDWLGTGRVADAPAGHGIGLGNAIDDENPVDEIGHGLHETRRGLPLEPDLIIDLV